MSSPAWQPSSIWTTRAHPSLRSSSIPALPTRRCGYVFPCSPAVPSLNMENNRPVTRWNSIFAGFSDFFIPFFCPKDKYPQPFHSTLPTKARQNLQIFCSFFANKDHLLLVHINQESPATTKNRFIQEQLSTLVKDQSYTETCVNVPEKFVLSCLSCIFTLFVYCFPQVCQWKSILISHGKEMRTRHEKN